MGRSPSAAEAGSSSSDGTYTRSAPAPHSSQARFFGVVSSSLLMTIGEEIIMLFIALDGGVRAGLAVPLLFFVFLVGVVSVPPLFGCGVDGVGVEARPLAPERGEDGTPPSPRSGRLGEAPWIAHASPRSKGRVGRDWR